MATESYVVLAVRLGYITEPGAAPLLGPIIDISNMLTILRQRLATA